MNQKQMVIQIWTLKMKARRNNTHKSGRWIQKRTHTFIYDFILFFILLNFIVTKQKVMFYRIFDSKCSLDLWLSFSEQS